MGDVIYGNYGRDTYVFNRGDGHDVINDRGGVDKIALGEGIVREELSVRRDGEHMVLLIRGAEHAEAITIEGAYVDSRHRIETVLLIDGTTFSPFDLPIYNEVETVLLVQAMSTFDSADSSLSTSPIEFSVEEVTPLVVNNQN